MRTPRNECYLEIKGIGCCLEQGSFFGWRACVTWRGWVFLKLLFQRKTGINIPGPVTSSNSVFLGSGSVGVTTSIFPALDSSNTISIIDWSLARSCSATRASLKGASSPKKQRSDNVIRGRRGKRSVDTLEVHCGQHSLGIYRLVEWHEYQRSQRTAVLHVETDAVSNNLEEGQSIINRDS